MLHVRCLPGTKGYIIDPNSKFPPNVAFYNPSATDDYVCIRVTEFLPTEDRSDMLLSKSATKETIQIKSPYETFLKSTQNIYKGLEDVRIVNFNDKLWFTSSCTHATSSMLNELMVGYFNSERTEIEYCQYVRIGTPPIKNICPFVSNNKLHLLDIYENTITILSYHETSDIKISIESTLNLTILPKHSYGRIRGSTSPIHLHGNIWGCVVHSVILNDAPTRTTQLSYLHHWMEFDIYRSAVTYISTPFWCMHWGVEFISGCLMKQKEKDEEPKIQLYLGVRDKLPAVIETTISHLRMGREGATK